MEAEKRNIFILAVLGYILEPYSDIEERIIKNLLSKSVTDVADGLIILGGLIDTGINKVAYDWAWENAVPTLGIAPTIVFEQKYAKYPLRLVNGVEKVGGDFGAERVRIASLASAAVIFGQTDHTDEIAELMRQEGKQVLDLSSDLPTPMKKIT